MDWVKVFKPHFYTINAFNLIAPFAANDWQLIRHWRREKPLAARLFAGLLYVVCQSTQLKGMVPVDLVADWLWGRGRRPANWHARLWRLCRWFVAFYNRSGVELLRLEPSPGRKDILYQADPRFLGKGLRNMVGRDGRLWLLRGVNTEVKMNRAVAALHRLRPDAKDEELKATLNSWRQDLRKLTTLGDLGRQKGLAMIYLPALLGDPTTCRRLRHPALPLATEHSRRYRVRQAQIKSFSDSGNVECRYLKPEVAYEAFAANGTRVGRGYRLEHWTRHFGYPDDPNKLFSVLGEAAESLELTPVGIDRADKLYSLEEMLQASPAVLETLHVRIYTPAGWQTRWCKLFDMPLLPETTAADAATVPAAPAQEQLSDRSALRALVLERGLRKTAADLGLSPPRLSRSLNGKPKGLSSQQIVTLREHVMGERPVGGPEIADRFLEAVATGTKAAWAMAYREIMSWRVIPVIRKPSGKIQPLIQQSKFYDCIPSIAATREWWERWPDADIALLLGPISGVLAIDIDNEPAMYAFLEYSGGLPDAPTQLSGSCGPETWYKQHYLFCYPSPLDTTTLMEPIVHGLEFKGNKGLLMLTPSGGKKPGSRYDWARGYGIWEKPLIPLPPKLLTALSEFRAGKQRPPAAPQLKLVESVAAKPIEGLSDRVCSGLRPATLAFLSGQVKVNRNKALFDAARDLRNRGVVQSIAQPLLVAGAEACNYIKTDGIDATLATIQSAYSGSSLRLAR